MASDSHPLVTMSGSLPLDQAYLATTYQIAGHGRRTVAVLKEVLEAVASNRPADTYGQGEVIESFQQKIANYQMRRKTPRFSDGDIRRSP